MRGLPETFDLAGLGAWISQMASEYDDDDHAFGVSRELYIDCGGSVDPRIDPTDGLMFIRANLPEGYDAKWIDRGHMYAIGSRAALEKIN